MTWITNRFFSWCEIGIKTMILLLLLMDTGAVRAQRNELVMATTFSPGATAWIIQRWQTEPESVMIRTLNRTSASLEQLLYTANVENVDLILTSSPMLLQHLQEHQKLAPFDDAPAESQNLVPESIRATSVAVAISGFGLLINRPALSVKHLPAPADWDDLALPIYQDALLMSSPSRSDTNHLMVESLLQQKGLVQKYENNNSIKPGATLSVGLFMLATIAIVILAAFPQLRPGFDISKPMETRDIIIICMLSAACLMVILCKMSTDDIILTSTFRAGMSSLAVILGIVTLGTTFIDAHLTEIKDIAGDILQTYPMLLALVLFFTCALLYSQGATTPLIIPLAVALNIPTWAILASYVAVTGVFVLPTYPTSLAAMEFDTTGTTRVGNYLLNHPFMLPGLGGVIAGVTFGFVIAPMMV